MATGLMEFSIRLLSISRSPFTLVNVDTDQDIQWLDNEEVIIVFPDTGINVRFNPAEDAESVLFYLNGKKARVENDAPFSLAGDANGNYHAWNQASAGTYELTAIPYSGKGGTGTPGTPLTIAFTIRDAPGSVTHVSLINAETDSELGIINDGDTIDLSTLPTHDLNMAATTEGNVSKIVFDHDGIIKQENQTPYALFGDNMGDFHGKDLNTGTHHLVVTLYSEGNIAGDALAITFYVINETSNARASANGSGAHTGIHVGTNPSSDVFNVVIHSAPAGTNQVEIFRPDGSLVKEVFNGNLNEGQEVNLSWEGTGNAPGIYLLKYTTESSQTVTKIVLGQ